MDILRHAEITEQIIKAFYRVYNTLGRGFLEKVYENAMAVEVCRSGFDVEQQKSVSVFYGDVKIGEYFADLAVNEKVIVELKVARKLVPEHEAQLLNYLKATRYEVGLLLNFGDTPEFRRRILDNTRKGAFSWCRPDP